jgi:hypothetical protein
MKRYLRLVHRGSGPSGPGDAAAGGREARPAPPRQPWWRGKAARRLASLGAALAVALTALPAPAAAVVPVPYFNCGSRRDLFQINSFTATSWPLQGQNIVSARATVTGPITAYTVTKSLSQNGRLLWSRTESGRRAIQPGQRVYERPISVRWANSNGDYLLHMEAWTTTGERIYCLGINFVPSELETRVFEDALTQMLR